MPFTMASGRQAVFVSNLCTKEDLARRLGVHTNSVRNWSKRRDVTHFPHPLAGEVYDYAEVYDWFLAWVETHSKYYPNHNEEEQTA